MKAYLSFFFLFLGIFCYSQKITVLDSIDHQKISYAEFIVDGTSYFSDSLGNIEITKKNTEKILIKKIGYNDKYISNIDKIVYLSPIIKDIEGVVIKNMKDYEFTSKYLSKNTTKLPNDLSLGFIIRGKENMVGKLKEISIPIKKIYNNNTLIKIDFYNAANETISRESLNEKSIFINVNDLIKRKKNKIDLQEYNIPIISDLLISIRIIDETGKTERLLNEPSIQFFNSKDKGKLFFFNQYVKDWKILSQNINLISLSYIISY
ncbi:hypothetical protein NZ698_02525 [Chryseobacterium sp. PBS4-4]|uniref:Carboxypeptidase-like regulatory domain-containing protein n=1 Tax=Chryseobacterium edaphi TaxID=2976532 RepID=A0ABT2W1G5_9FLAO|nr:hypothetical protein [Chryseobacterium edaphi]MCU7616061.1 hypothetical protein [Chryseobacterium edaphi]